MFAYGAWAEDALELAAGCFVEDDPSDDLDAASGGSGASAYEHEEEEQYLGGGGPEVEIGCGESGGGHEAGDLKCGIAQGGGKSIIGSILKKEPGDEKCGDDDDADVGAPFRVAQQRAGIAAEYAVVEREVGSGDHHEDDDDDLDRDVVESGDAVGVGGESSGGERGEGVAEGVEPSHAAKAQGDGFCQRESTVEFPHEYGCVLDAGREGLGDWARYLVLHEGSSARAEEGEKRDEEDNDPHAAEPVSEAAPEVQTLRKCTKILQDGGSGGCEAGHGFEVAINEGVERAAQIERERSGCSGQEPAESYDGGRFFAEELLGAQGANAIEDAARCTGDGY